MLYIYYGSDRIKALGAAEKIIAKVKADEIIFFDEATVNAEAILSLAEQQGLFGGTKLIKLDGVLENSAEKERILKNLEVLKKSPSLFIFLEDSLKADTVKEFKKFAEKIEEFKLLKKKEDFNIFALGDAFGMRDKKSFWVLFRRAIEAGKNAEEISGTLFWQIKSMLIVQAGDGGTLSPYVAGKAKRYLNNFKKDELRDFASNLLKKYHEAHRGRGDLETALERFALSL